MSGWALGSNCSLGAGGLGRWCTVYFTLVPSTTHSIGQVCDPLCMSVTCATRVICGVGATNDVPVAGHTGVPHGRASHLPRGGGGGGGGLGFVGSVSPHWAHSSSNDGGEYRRAPSGVSAWDAVCSAPCACPFSTSSIGAAFECLSALRGGGGTPTAPPTPAASAPCCRPHRSRTGAFPWSPEWIA